MMPIPRRFLVCVAIVAASHGLLASPQTLPPGVAGRWEGSVDIGGVQLPFAVVFSDRENGAAATIDIQTARALPLQAVNVTASTVHFEMPSSIGVAVFEGTLKGPTIAGTFVQGITRGPFTLTREGTPKPPSPPAAPLPYREEEVTFKNGPVTLAGTLTMPEGPGPFPAFVMITGSGPQNRDEELFGFKAFRVIADYVTRRGVAVLRYDDRGMGGSTGSLATATTSDFADDALAGAALLAARPEVDRAHIGLVGHSEGADVAAIAAVRSKDVAFIVMMAGMTLRGDVILRHQAEDGARALGAGDEAVAKIVAAHHQLTDAVRNGAAIAEVTPALEALIRAQLAAQPPAARAAIGDIDTFIARAMPAALAQNRSAWMRYFVTFDPAPVLAQVTCPVLALFGEHDTQVRPDLNRPALEAAFATGGNSRVTVKVYPAANHLFITSVTGLVAEYPALDKTFVPGLLEDLVSWVHSVTRGRN